MNRTKLAIVDTFWQLLEEKSYHKITVQDIVDRCQVNRNTFYYHFQDIPSLAEWSVETWADAVIKNRGVLESPANCISYMAEECTKRKTALLHLYRSAKKEFFLGYLNKMAEHVIHSYVETKEGYLTFDEEKTKILMKYYKCTLIGILLDWLENDASYDLIAFCGDFCELLAGSGENAFLRCVISRENHV